MGNPGGERNRTASNAYRLLHPFEFRGRLHLGPDRTRADGADGQRRAARDRPGSRRRIPSRGTGAPGDRRRQDPRHSLEFSVSVREGRSSCALFCLPGAALRRQPVECRLVREEKYTMAANRTPAPLRLVRLARLALHLVRGLAIAWLRYPKLSEAEQNAQKRRWSRTLLSILSVSVREQNAPKKLPERCMLALNHISWLDIFVIDTTFPATFV